MPQIENATQISLPLKFKARIIYTLAMKARELVHLAQAGVASPEDILAEEDCLLQAAQQVWFSPDSAEPTPKEETLLAGPEELRRLASLLSDGWIAQDESGTWFFYYERPEAAPDADRWDNGNHDWYSLSPFNLPRLGDWRDSLYQIKDGKILRNVRKSN